MKKTLLVLVLLLFGGLGFGATASAQDVSCNDLIWTDTAREVNPNIADFCLEVVDKRGEPMAKLTARVVRQSVNSTIVQWRTRGSMPNSRQAFRRLRPSMTAPSHK